MPTSNTTRAGSLRLWVAIAAFILTAIFVNPLRETTLNDDWANALTVRGLLDAGTYSLNDWAAANMPFQAYLGAGFSLVLGYSPGILRLATLLMALVGLVALYKLAREHDMDERTAGLLSCVWLASPLLLRMSYTFMTDVTFVALLVTATWLYSRGARTRAPGTMILASLAASACVLTAPFGMAIVVGVILLWLSDRELRGALGLLAVGIALPVAASVWQVVQALSHPTWGQAYASAAQALYVGNAEQFAAGILRRPTVLMFYLALFLLPLIIPAMSEFLHSIRSGEGRRRSLATVFVSAVVFACGLFIGHELLDTPRMMPLAQWNFGIINRFGTIGRGAFTVAFGIGAVLIARAIIAARFGRGSWHGASIPGRLLSLTALILLVLTVVYFKFGDEQLLAFIPFAVITVGYYLRSWIARLSTVTAISALMVLAGAALWTRGNIASEDAGWLLGEELRTKGVPVAEIHGTLNWNCYNGLFDEYLKAIDRQNVSDLNGFYRWYHERQERCNYVITASPRAESDSLWKVRSRAQYRDFLLGTQHVYILERVR